MFQQTSKIIVQVLADVTRGKKAKGYLEYINDILSYNKHGLHKFDPNNRDQLLDILKANALYYISRSIAFMKDDKHSFDAKLNNIYQNDFVKLAQAHAVYLLCTEFAHGIENAKISQNLKTHLNRLCNIQCANMILKYGDGAILSKFAKPKHLYAIEEFLYEQTEQFRPQLLNILEACGIPEFSLHSVIGSNKGKIYETLYETSSMSRLNNKTSLDWTPKYLKPLSQQLKAKI